MNDYNFRSPSAREGESLKLISSIWSKGGNPFLLKNGVLFLIAMVLLLGSCSEGFESGETFSAGVENATLESPVAATITFTPNIDGDEVKIAWPVVYGAGGYQLSFYIVDDPDNPVAVGAENEIVDGCSVTRDLAEDTKYQVVIKTLGNEQLNNTGATAASTANYTTLVAATDIPDGTDLTTYFASAEYESDAAFALAAGGSYTMSGPIALGVKNIQIRGDKINQPTVTASGGFETDGAGLTLKFINFDLTGISGTNGFIKYASPSTDMPVSGSDSYLIMNPVVVSGCEVSGLTTRFMNTSNSSKFYISQLYIKNSVLNMALADYFIYFTGRAFIANFSILNSTLNNSKDAPADKYFYQTGNGSIAKSSGQALLKWQNSTFYNLSFSKDKAFNYSMMAQSVYTINVASNIFEDCFNDGYVRAFTRDSGNPATQFASNCYWYNGAASKESELSRYDGSATRIDADPGFVDPANGDFTVTNAQVQSAAVGDPRWLPAE